MDPRRVYRAWCERHPPELGGGMDVYTDAEREWLRAVEDYREANRRRFPALTELLAIAVALGYEKRKPRKRAPRREPHDLGDLAAALARERAAERAGVNGPVEPA